MKNKKKQKRIVFITIILAISCLSIVFIVNNFQDNIVFFYSPSDVQSKEAFLKIKDRNIRVGGLVKKGSIKQVNALTTIFQITDLEKDLEIYYEGILPDLFRQEQGIVARGKYYFEKNQFVAQELLIKHDENYMPPEIKESLKYKNKVN